MICIKCGAETPDAPYCSQCGFNQQGKIKSRSRRGNGQGRVFKRGKSWYAQITLYCRIEDKDGKKVYRQKYKTKGGFKTKKEALDYIPVLRGSDGRKTPLLLDLYTLWERNDLPKLSKDKQSGYKKARERIDGIIGRKIDELTLSDIQTVVDTNCYSYYTAKDVKTLLSHLFNKAIPDKFVTINLAKYITLPELNETEAEPFTEDEVRKMWLAYSNGDTFVGYLLVMIYTGMMPGELLACKKDMIDFDKREIIGCGKKTKKRKEVPIVFPEAIAPVLRSLIDLSKGDKLITRQKDKWYDDYHAALTRIKVRDLPPYSCRHTTGTQAAKLNLSAPIIQNIMRHAKITTTQKYIHLAPETTHDALNQLPKK